jgi:hypothetical protein
MALLTGSLLAIFDANVSPPENKISCGENCGKRKSAQTGDASVVKHAP